MVDTIYIETAVLEHPRTQAVCARYANAQFIEIAHYGEVFNSHAQNFRLQKQNPALILAAKHNKRVQVTPAQYETGGSAHYYFSHMLNCLYDCRYCFLQGMFRSANYLLFVNYDDFLADIQALAEQHKNASKPVWFFSGYDCDSLAYEPVTRFAEYFVPAFKEIPNAVLELRTKSTQIRSLLNTPPQANVVIASSLSPEPVAKAVESGAPSLAKRLDALAKLQQQGWRIGLRFDPIIWHQDYLANYQQMVTQVFAKLDADKIDSLTLGSFRLPKGYYKTMQRLYPEHWLFAAGLSETDGMVQYTQQIEQEAFSAIQSYCLNFVEAQKIFMYQTQ